MIEEDKRKLHRAVDKFIEETKSIDIELSRIYNAVLGGNYDQDLLKDIDEIYKRIDTHKNDAGKINLTTFSTDVAAQKSEFNITGPEIKDTFSSQSRFLGDIKSSFVRLYNIEIDALNKELDTLKNIINTELSASSERTALENDINDIKRDSSTLKASVGSTIVYNTNIKDNLKVKDLTNLQEKFRKLIDKKIKTNSNEELKRYYSNRSMNEFVDRDFDFVEGKFDILEQSLTTFKYSNGAIITKDMLKNDLDFSVPTSATDLSSLDESTRKSNLEKMGLQQALEYLSISVIKSRNYFTEDKYRAYVKKIEDFYLKFNEMKKEVNDAINTITVAEPSVADKYKDYLEEMKKVSNNALRLRKYYLVALLDSENNKLSYANLLDVNNKTKKYSKELDDILSNIEADKDNLGDQLYNNLKTSIEDRKKRIAEIKEELTNPRALSRNVSGNDLNKNLKTITEDIGKINEKMEEYKSKRIIPRKERKNIDKSISEIDDKIETLEKFLDLIEDKNSREYKEISEQLKTQKDRLKVQKKYYKKKTPKLVRFRKSAKNWFKKHKKGLLIAAGLATLAILAQPVLIPAIMHGNILMSGAVPAMKSTLMGINSTLCNLVGAKAAGGVITFSNGVMLSPTVVSNALLKGVAASGISSALLISPVIALIYDVGKKIKNKQFLQQFRNKKQQLSDLNQRRKDRKEKRAIKRANKVDERKLRDAAIDISKIDPTDTNAINAIYTKYDITDEDDKRKVMEYAEVAKNRMGRR